MGKGQKTRLDVTTLMDVTGLYATGGAVTVVAAKPVTGSVTGGFRLSQEGATDVLSAFSYLVRNVVPCKTRVLVTTKLTRVSPLGVVKGLCCPFAVNVYTLLTVLFQCPEGCS